ncbi:uncharacterized protein LOC131926924, partial [Physella acuta]|uniref:uncharacterized protein LOC131926924 n=1 Tax=Physella acuta TaxID=109671 RepID=UPI0027DD4D48
DCPSYLGYQIVSVDPNCDWCLRLKTPEDPRLNYTEARNACNSDGADLFHFENLVNVKLEDIIQYLWLYQTSSADEDVGYWIGANSIESPGVFVWDHNKENLTQEQLSDVPLDTGEPGVSQEESCLFLTSDFGQVLDAKCDKLLSYICMVML